jgi:hypothetical protein
MTARPKKNSLLFWMQKKRRRRRVRGVDHTIPRSLKDVLSVLDPDLLGSHIATCPITQMQWQEAAGKRNAQKSAPQRLGKDGSLLVKVTSSVWAQELSLLSSSLCERLQSQGHRVKVLRFVVGTLDPVLSDHARFEERRIPRPSPIPEELRPLLDEIEDEKLRLTLEEVMAASLAASELKPKS